MNLLEFANKFPDEVTCRQRLKEIRDKEGVECKKCACTDHYWLSTRQQFQCQQCGFRTTLTSGTVMEDTKLPVRLWFMGMHLITSTKKSISAKELQRQLGLKRYQPAWEMLHKLRMIMGKRDACYEMEDYVEVDEGFFGVVSEKKIDALEIADDKGQDEQKRGRGSEKKAKVLVMVESEPVAQESSLSKHKPQRKVRHAKMFQMEDLKAQTIEKEITEHVDPESEVKTDGYRSYSRLKDKVKKHEQVTASGKNATKELPWVHIVISNAKRLFLGIHHMIKDTYLQNYLNEFCYKFNRRYMYDKLFDRLLVASISSNWY